MEKSLLIQTSVRELLRGHPWQESFFAVDTLDSTNTALREMAREGAPQGTCLLALEQTGGRGRQGRSFHSPRGQGLYLSVLLRPHCIPAQASHVTLMAAVAACDAVESVTGLRPGIKWTNDLVVGTKKVAGILTEMDANWAENTIDHIILGIGLNLNQRSHDFPEDLQSVAGSLWGGIYKETDLAQMTAALITRFSQMCSGILTGKERWLGRYRKDCVTLGKEVKILRGQNVRYGWALDVDDEGGLTVRYPGGETETVYSGEVSVRGIYGYADN